MEINPAIQTLGKLQGAWKNMETDLKAIKGLVEFDTENIPPMLITKPQLEGIVDSWNELKQYGMLESTLYKSPFHIFDFENG